MNGTIVIITWGLPNAMSRATNNFGDEKVGDSLSNRNAIITSSNFGVSDIDTTRAAYVNAIRVWAISWSI